MDNIKIELLDLSKKENIEKYERLLYKSYSKNDPDGWVINNYKLSNERLTPLIEYNDLLVYAAVLEEKLVAAGTINLGNKLQLEKMGFKVDRAPDSCEGINMVTDNEAVPDFMKLTADLVDFIFDELKERGLKRVYSTCEKKVKGLYYMLGFDIMDETVTFENGVVEYMTEYIIGE